MATISILLAIQPESETRFKTHLESQDGFKLRIINSTDDIPSALASQGAHTDVLIIDNSLGDVFELIRELRQGYPRLLIILIDEEADFGMPGQADEISTDPFRHNDLAQKIRRLMSDRQLETIRSDSLPAVRNIAKRLRTATGRSGKQEAAVATCKDMGYDYVAYYHIATTDPMKLEIKAQQGAAAVQSIAPKFASPDDLMGWVAQSGQSRIAAPEDTPNHPLVSRGRLGAVACVPVSFSGTTYGVMAICNDRPASLTQENVMMLELVAAQLASALSKER